MTGKHALKTPPKATRSPQAATAGTATAAEAPGDARARLTAVVRHPAAAPTAVTLVAVLLVMGVGWLNDSSEPEPSRLATPLAAGGSYSGSSRGDSGSSRGAASQQAATQGTVVVIQGRQAIALHTWMDVPLVAPAVAANPTAPHTMIPGAEPTETPPPGSGSSSGSGGGSTAPPGGASGSGGGSGSTATTHTPTTGNTTTPTTASDTTPTTADTTPTTETPTTETPTTETPTTETPTTETPTTETPTTLALDPIGGLLGAVDDLVGDVTGLVAPPL
jgi:hypothetical protein